MPNFLKGLVFAATLLAAPVQADAGDKLPNDLGHCAAGRPGALVHVRGLKSGTGTVRVQLYRATKAEWLAKGKWLARIEEPARAGTMDFCVPVDAPGRYGIAVRHDANGNGKTDFSRDGGGMSNNPSISIFNMGKPSASKVAVSLGQGVSVLDIRMKYLGS